MQLWVKNKKKMLHIWITLLGRKRAFFQYLLTCLRLPGSPTGLTPGKWLMRTQRGVFLSPSWNGNCRTLWYLSAASHGRPCLAMLCLTQVFRTAMEETELSKGIFTLLFLVLSQCTQLFSANALWGLGSVFNTRSALSTNV